MAKQGIRCPRCECGMSDTKRTTERTITWNGQKMTFTKRKRSCRHCGYVWYTNEISEELIDQEIFRQTGQYPR